MDKIPLMQQFEREVEEEALEWKKERLKEKMQQIAQDKGEISPPQPNAVDPNAPDDNLPQDSERLD